MPGDAFKLVYKDGYYYYIGADDYISQKNFALLAIIEDVQAVAPSPPISDNDPRRSPMTDPPPTDIMAPIDRPRQ